MVIGSVVNKVVDMPAGVQRQAQMVQTVLETGEVQQLQFIDKVIKILVLTRRQIPVVQTMQMTFRDSTVATQ